MFFSGEIISLDMWLRQKEALTITVCFHQSLQTEQKPELVHATKLCPTDLIQETTGEPLERLELFNQPPHHCSTSRGDNKSRLASC